MIREILQYAVPIVIHLTVVTTIYKNISWDHDEPWWECLLVVAVGTILMALIGWLFINLMNWITIFVVWLY